ncbi:cytochrome b5 domain-containing protein [Macrococcus animalis]|uniref:cytochrome b5 domain-containing protein n=1 Tax=Macrococcus animalis TaxID=3395467 RepID=UPI0039BE943B
MKKLMLITGVILVAAFMGMAFYMNQGGGEDKLARDFTPAEEKIMKANVYDAEKLKAFDGKDGHKAYVAVNGTVYDVSDVEMWKEGKHNGLEAGKDLTDGFKSSPHGGGFLKDLKVVGSYK